MAVTAAHFDHLLEMDKYRLAKKLEPHQRLAVRPGLFTNPPMLGGQTVSMSGHGSTNKTKSPLSSANAGAGRLIVKEARCAL